jgi:hypothetical protein
LQKIPSMRPDPTIGERSVDQNAFLAVHRNVVRNRWLCDMEGIGSDMPITWLRCARFEAKDGLTMQIFQGSTR